MFILGLIVVVRCLFYAPVIFCNGTTGLGSFDRRAHFIRMDTVVAPRVSPEYIPERALDDLPAIRYAEALFLDSKMVESEEYCLELDPEKYAF